MATSLLDQTRQCGPIKSIRRDHTQRYQFAAERLKGKRVLDLACGCGYGSWILHQSGNEVTGVDIEPEAIAYAKEHYQGPTYICQAGEETKGSWDVLVSFETLEHLERPQDVLAIGAKTLIASVPNEERYPFKAENFSGDKYPHQRHYTPEEFQKLLESAGYQVVEWFCQKDKKGDIVPGSDGMFLLAIGQRLFQR